MNDFLKSILRHLKHYGPIEDLRDLDKARKEKEKIFLSNNYNIINENSYIISNIVNYYKNKIVFQEKHIAFLNSFNKTKYDKILHFISGVGFMGGASVLGWAFGSSIMDFILYTTSLTHTYSSYFQLFLLPICIIIMKLSMIRFFISSDKIKLRFMKSLFVKNLNKNLEKINIDMINELECFKFTSEYSEYELETNFLINYIKEKDNKILNENLINDLFHDVYYKTTFRNNILLNTPKLCKKLIKGK